MAGDFHDHFKEKGGRMVINHAMSQAKSALQNGNGGYGHLTIAASARRNKQ